MLWEGACLEWAKGAKAGLLRATAAKTNWAPWEREMTVARDSEGPRGYLRLSVKTKDNVINFQDIFKGEHLGAHTEARHEFDSRSALQIFKSQVFSNPEHGDAKFTDWGAMKDIAQRSLSAGGLV